MGDILITKKKDKEPCNFPIQKKREREREREHCNTIHLLDSDYMENLYSNPLHLLQMENKNKEKEGLESQ